MRSHVRFLFGLFRRFPRGGQQIIGRQPIGVKRPQQKQSLANSGDLFIEKSESFFCDPALLDQFRKLRFERVGDIRILGHERNELYPKRLDQLREQLNPIATALWGEPLSEEFLRSIDTTLGSGTVEDFMERVNARRFR